MRFALAQLNKHTPRFVALALCLWLSGAMCAVSCGAMTARASNGEETEKSSCPMHREPSCHEKNGGAKTALVVSAQTDEPMSGCCPFINFQSETARKIKQPNVPVLTETAANAAFSPQKTAREIVFRPIYRAAPRTRGDTYLRNCVFLI